MYLDNKMLCSISSISSAFLFSQAAPGSWPMTYTHLANLATLRMLPTRLAPGQRIPAMVPVAILPPDSISEPRMERQANEREVQQEPFSVVPKEPKPGYSTSAYWDSRYASKMTSFDWFFSYAAIRGLLCSCLRKDLPCLHVGCGNSGLQDGMSNDGFQSVTNVDISPVVIEQLRMNPSSGNVYDVVDCRDMPQYANGSFAGVLDKGTLDAVLCCKGGLSDAMNYCKEVSRILAPDGIFLLITLGTPKARINLLEAGNVSWDIKVVLLPKPSGFYQTEVKLTGRRPSFDPETRAGIDSKDAPVRTFGPYSVPEASVLIGEDPSMTPKLDPHDYFFAYICRKQGAAVHEIQATQASSLAAAE